jgi:GTP-binding protein EngB required for normal cell division
MNAPCDPTLRLRLAADSAVTACRSDHRAAMRRAAALRGRLNRARATLTKAGNHAPRDPEAAEEFRQAVEDAGTALAAAEADLKHHLALRKRTADTLVISMFGKTHSGKSLLAEALTRGDGATVSTGRTGFTDTVADLTPPLTVLDCPGFGPPGPERARHDAAARDGVLQSDVVLLVFRDDHQKAEEFEQIATWVKRFDKPVVAVFNVFNDRWNCTLPSVPTTQAGLARLDQTVAEHVEHIERQLARVGLQHVPVLVVSAKRAHFARHGAPYRGPNAVECRRWRDELPREAVAAAANLPPLEAMLMHLIEAHGATLRREALAGDVRGAARRVVDALRPVLVLAEKERDTYVEHFDELLRWAGDPRHDSRLRWALDEADAEAAQTLQAAATSLGLARRQGQCGLERESASGFAAHPGRVVRAAYLRVGATADQAMREGGLGHRAAMQSLRLDPDLANAQEQWKAGLRAHVDATLARWSRTLGEDLRAAHADAADAADAGVKVGGDVGLKIGDFLSRAVGVVGSFLGPLGWAASAVASVTGWLFRRSRKKREAKRRKAIHESLTKAIAKVDTECRSSTEAELCTLRTAILVNVGADFAALARGRAACAGALRGLVDDLTTLVGEATSLGGSAALADAIRHVLARFGGGPAEVFQARLPRGAGRAARRGGGRGQRPRRAPSRRRPARSPSPAIVAAALADTRGRLAQDPLLAPLRELVDALPATSARSACLALVGDYSVGKTSLVRRLCIDLALGDAGEHAVGGAPTTSDVVRLRWDAHTHLLDAPGFHGGDPAHDARARHAARRATGLVLLVPPGIASAGDDEVRPLLGWRGPIPPAPVRVVIGRADELGVSPELDEAGFAQRVTAKRSEAAEHLGVPLARIHAVAADPYGLADDAATPSSFDAFRAWDGMAPLVAALDDEAALQRRSGPALAQLRCAAHDLLDAADAAESRQKRAADQEKLAARIRDAWSTAVRRLEALEAAIPARIQDAVRPFIGGHLAAIEAAEDTDALQRALERTEGWPETATGAVEGVWHAVHADVDAILEDCARTVDEALASPLGRRVRRAHAATPDATVPGDGPQLGTLFDLLGKASKGAGKALGKDMKQVRAAVLKIGHRFGKKFRPWEATRYAKHLGKAGKVLRKLGPVLVVVGEIVDLVQTHRAREAFDAARRDAREVLARSLVDLSTDLAHAEPDGLATVTASLREALSTRRDAACLECDALHQEGETSAHIAGAARAEATRLARLLPIPTHTVRPEAP